MRIQAGEKVSQCSAEDHEGNFHTLYDHLGKWLLLRFCPKDTTLGCTKEACGIRDEWARLQRITIAVFWE